MPKQKSAFPSYCLHKRSGQAVIRFSDRDVYLGTYDSPESRERYDRFVAEWLANGRRIPAEWLTNGRQVLDPATETPVEEALTVDELIVRYMEFAKVHYRKNGAPTREVENIKDSLRPLHQIYGSTPATSLGPKRLKTLRERMIADDLARSVINQRVGRIVRAFKWAASEELIPVEVYRALTTVSGLQSGRTKARETEPIGPVADALVDAIRPHVARQVWAMIELQRLSGMRPGEVVIMRTCDLDTSGANWVYTPEQHKMEHKGRSRPILLGPRAQAVIKPWLRTDLEGYLFSPGEARAERFAAMRAGRKTRVQPSQADRRKAKGRRRPGVRYTTQTYRNAVAYGCDRAFPHPTLDAIERGELTPPQRAELKAWRREHHWHPNRLRHNAATLLRREFGLDVAQVVLGHASPNTTLIYAEADRHRAEQAMLRIG